MTKYTYPSPEYHNSGISLSKNLLLAAIPLIIAIAFISGSIAFFVGQKYQTEHGARQKLPIAEERYGLFAISLSNGVRQLLNPAIAAPEAIITNEPGNWIRISTLNVNVPLVLADTMDDNDVLKTLAKGVALYPNGVLPGQKGNVFIAGHSTGEPWKGAYRFAFLNLSKLKTDDTILLDYDNNRYTYTITGTRIIDPKVLATIDSHGEEPTLSLMACWPLWTSTNRMLVEAKLTATNPLVVRAK